MAKPKICLGTFIERFTARYPSPPKTPKRGGWTTRRGRDRAEVKKILHGFWAELIAALARGEKVWLHDFGTFRLVWLHEPRRLSPLTGHVIYDRPGMRLYFKPAPLFRKHLNYRRRTP